MATGVCSARDADGHGTHTASTAAGSPVASAPLFGIERGPINGIAPGAHVIMYRVCLDQGCFQSDSVAAIEQAILDGVDVINFSIGGGASPFSDPVELAFLEAYAAGITVNASAGNAGPGAGTADHGGPWVNTVGASTSNRHFLTTLELAAGGRHALAERRLDHAGHRDADRRRPRDRRGRQHALLFAARARLGHRQGGRLRGGCAAATSSRSTSCRAARSG